MVTASGTKVKTFACPKIMDFNPPLENPNESSEKDHDWKIDWDDLKHCEFALGKIHVISCP